MKVDLTEGMVQDFCAGLHLHMGFCFPLVCPGCGASYDSAATFISKTWSVDNLGGVAEGYDTEHHRLIEVLRRCPCGHLLFEAFDDRRHNNASGVVVRTTFSRLLRELRAKGVSWEEAHTLLVNALHERGSGGLDSVVVG